MNRQAGNVTAAAASFGLLMTAVVVAAPIAAAEESGADTWTMPDTENSMLKNAVAATYEAAGTEAIEFEYSFSGFPRGAQRHQLEGVRAVARSG